MSRVLCVVNICHHSPRLWIPRASPHSSVDNARSRPRLELAVPHGQWHLLLRPVIIPRNPPAGSDVRGIRGLSLMRGHCHALARTTLRTCVHLPSSANRALNTGHSSFHALIPLPTNLLVGWSGLRRSREFKRQAPCSLVELPTGHNVDMVDRAGNGSFWDTTRNRSLWEM